MVYCSKCGTLNPDYAVNCSNCGAPLQTAPQQTSPNDWHERHRRYYREDSHNYYPRNRGLGLLVAGIIVIIIALGILLQNAKFWSYFFPVIFVVFGVWLVAMFLLRNRRHSQSLPRQPA